MAVEGGDNGVGGGVGEHGEWVQYGGGTFSQEVVGKCGHRRVGACGGGAIVGGDCGGSGGVRVRVRFRFRVRVMVRVRVRVRVWVRVRVRV